MGMSATNRMMVLWKACAVLAAAAVTAVAFAPAAWVADAVEARGPLRLIHASGTVWDGSAMLAVSDGRVTRLMPGRLAWRVDWGALWAGHIGLILRHPALAAAVPVGFDGKRVQVQAGEAQLPAALLAVLGAPFNTVRPGGTLRLRWDTLAVGGGVLDGRLQLDWEEAQSALCPVAPLGRFRVTAYGGGGVAHATLSTLQGPLLLEGEGSLDAQRVRFSGSARAQPDMRASLDGLIGVLGRRSGEGAVLNWELRR